MNIRRTKAGGLLKDVRAINEFTENDILAGVRHHSTTSEPYFYDTSYNHTNQHGPIPSMVVVLLADCPSRLICLK